MRCQKLLGWIANVTEFHSCPISNDARGFPPKFLARDRAIHQWERPIGGVRSKVPSSRYVPAGSISSTRSPRAAVAGFTYNA